MFVELCFDQNMVQQDSESRCCTLCTTSQTNAVEEGGGPFFTLSFTMKCVFVFALFIAALCDPLPHKYMALRGYNIKGHDLKNTGIKIVGFPTWW